MKRVRPVRWIVAAIVILAVVALLRQSPGPDVVPGSTLVVELSGEYVEAPAAPILARLLGDQRRPFVGLLSTLALAKRDDRIATVVLRIRDLGIGWGKAQEIRQAILRLHEAGRKTIAYLDMASVSAAREYYVASAADEIYASPGAAVPVVGLAAEYLFLGGLWEKLGVEIESERIGRYKTAVDSYTGSGMSDAHREMANSLLDSINDQFVAGIAAGRGLSEQQVRDAIDAGPAVPEELLALGLIDGIAHLDELEPMSAPHLEASRYAAVDPGSVGFEPVAKFALIYGSGTVVSGKATPSPRGSPAFAADTVGEALENAAKASDIDAIILRIDSPGGSSLASEQIWRAIQKARESGKPVIASMSDVAASGGYYAAVAADEIVASPGVLTGSIGVFVLRPILGGLFDKLGIGVESLTRGRHADVLLSTEPLSSSARERIRTLVESTYALFLKRVADGRAIEVERIDALGQGRVWTGAQALENGLIDVLGGLHTAVDRGRRALGLEEDADVVLVPFPAPKGLADELADLMRGDLGPTAGLGLPLGELGRALARVLVDLPTNSPLLIPPALVDIH